MDGIFDAGQVSSIAGAVQGVAGLSAGAQIATATAVGVVASLWVWTRRPVAPTPFGEETLTLVVKSMEEQSRATSALAQQVERLVEQNADILRMLKVEI